MKSPLAENSLDLQQSYNGWKVTLEGISDGSTIDFFTHHFSSLELPQRFQSDRANALCLSFSLHTSLSFTLLDLRYRHPCLTRAAIASRTTNPMTIAGRTRYGTICRSIRIFARASRHRRVRGTCGPYPVETQRRMCWPGNM